MNRAHDEAAAVAAVAPDPSALLARFHAVRHHSLALAEPLSPEDCALQSMPDASPTKWHLAHTTWFFETLVLAVHQPGWRPVNARWAQLFNSYYESLGPRHPRPQRGLLSRPSLAEVLGYRRAVDAAVAELLLGGVDAAAAATIELGLQHEQQHQELLLTDILHALSCNPLEPAMRPGPAPREPVPEPGWCDHAGGAVRIGHPAHDPGFAFDNEGPAHTVWLEPFALARRLVTHAEYQAFVDDGGYREPRWWLSDGWATVQAQRWEAPLYWRPDGTLFTLHGVQPREPDQPVRHLSLYEAAAYAQWAAAQTPGVRLPTEFEWEAAVRGPAPPVQAFVPEQAFGVAWQWTRSSYDPYPRYRVPDGAVGEYNGKFMVGQLVLRGSSSATPEGHARATYRNFFPPAARWQFTGLRLACDR